MARPLKSLELDEDRGRDWVSDAWMLGAVIVIDAYLVFLLRGVTPFPSIVMILSCVGCVFPAIFRLMDVGISANLDFPTKHFTRWKWISIPSAAVFFGTVYLYGF